MAYYGWYAETYGWTPEQVDGLPDLYAARVRAYHDMVIDVAERKQSGAGDARVPSGTPDGPGVMRVRYGSQS